MTVYLLDDADLVWRDLDPAQLCGDGQLALLGHDQQVAVTEHAIAQWLLHSMGYSNSYIYVCTLLEYLLW